MNLRKKKQLAAKTLEVGKNKIVFVKSRLDEIKDAITKQDIRDLYQGGAILIREKIGRRTVKKIRKRRSVGNVRKKIKNRKGKYVILTRKLRKHLGEWRKNKEITELSRDTIRKRIKNKEFKNKSHFNEYLKNLKI